MGSRLPPLALRSEGLRAAVAGALGSGGRAEPVASLTATISTVDHLCSFKIPNVEAKAFFAPLLPAGASNLQAGELGDALRAAEKALVTAGRSCSRGRRTAWATRFDLIVDGSGGAGGDEGGQRGALTPTTPTTGAAVVRVQLTAANQRGPGVQFSLSTGWFRALRAAGAYEVGSQLVLERFEAATATSSNGDGDGFAFVATATGRVAPPPSSEQVDAADLARRAETEALSVTERLSRRRALVEAHGRRKGRGASPPTLAASLTITLKKKDHLHMTYLPIDEAQEVFGYALPEATRGRRGQELFWAFVEAAEQEEREEEEKKQQREEDNNGDDGNKEEGGEEGEPRGAVWSTFVEITDALSGETFPVSLDAVLRMEPSSGAGGDAWDGGGAGGGRAYAALHLRRNWCDVVRAAFGAREVGARILLERYDFGEPGEPPLVVATGLPRRSPGRGSEGKGKKKGK